MKYFISILTILFLNLALPHISAGDYAKGFESYCKGDYKSAFKEFMNDQDHPESQFFLGFMYHSGRGVPINYSMAKKWYSLSASQGYAHAQYHLGSLYAEGKGVQQDYFKAEYWYRGKKL